MHDSKPLILLDVGIALVRKALVVTASSAERGEVSERGGKLPVWSAKSKPAEFGEALFRAVFREKAGSLFYETRGSASSSNRKLCIRLKFCDDDGAVGLLNLPWELLKEPSRHEFLALDRDIFLVRYLQQLRPPAGHLEVECPKVLIAVGYVSGLDWRTEVEQVQRAVQDSGGRVEVLKVATRESLVDTCQRMRPDIFHFIGHGEAAWGDTSAESERTGCILLPHSSHHRNQGPDPLDGTALANLLRGHEGPSLVFLNSCSGAELRTDKQPLMNCVATHLILAGTPNVLAMTRPVRDGNAVHFASFFYRHLTGGANYLEAVASARQAAQIHPDPSQHFAAPALFTRGALTETQHAASAQQPATKQQHRTSTRIDAQDVCGGDVEIAGVIDRSAQRRPFRYRSDVEVRARGVQGETVSIAGTIIGKRSPK